MSSVDTTHETPAESSRDSEKQENGTEPAAPAQSDTAASALTNSLDTDHVVGVT